jgi:molybdate transport system permease protein
MSTLDDPLRITAFTLLMASAATALMLVPGVGLGWILATRRFTGKAVLETLVSLPLVMPPVAMGLILLKLFGRRGPIGTLLAGLGVDVIFTWKAVVIAMAVMGLPLLVRTARAGFEQIDHRLEAIAATLGASPRRVFLTISLPLAARAIVAGAILGFSRALGEFGATVLVAGSIPGGTRTLSVAIYTLTETGRDEQAALLVGLSALLAFVAVLASNRISRGAAR